MNRVVRHGIVVVLMVVGAFASVSDRVCANSPTLLWPARGPITQSFSLGHTAVDIGVPVGTPVGAANAGTVVFANWTNNGGGLMVQIDHGNGVLTSYAHLSQIEVGYGQWVNPGQRIALSGVTGNVTGPHLHFGLVINGVEVDPLPLLVVRLPGLPDTAVTSPGC